MMFGHFLSLLQEVLSLVLSTHSQLRLYLLGPQEHCRFRKRGAQDSRKEEERGSTPKHDTPSAWVVWNKREVDDGGEKVTNSITLLNNTTPETTKLNGKALESCRHSKTPNSTHGNTTERSDYQKLVERLHKAC